MEKYTRQKGESDAVSEQIEKQPEPSLQQEVEAESPDKFDTMQSQIGELVSMNRALLLQQVELQKRFDALEKQKEQERLQLVTSPDGRSVEIPDSMPVRTGAYRVKIIKPITPSSPNKHVRYASERTIDRRLAQGWVIHPNLGDPKSGVRQIRDLIPIEIDKDSPDIMDIRAAKEDREKAHERELKAQNAVGKKFDERTNSVRFTEYKQEKSFERTK